MLMTPKRFALSTFIVCFMSLAFLHAEYSQSANTPERAQASSKPNTINIDSPIITISFFDFQAAMVREIERRQAQDPVSGERFETASMALLGLGKSDFTKLSRVSRSTSLRLKAIQGEQRAYLQQVKERKKTFDQGIIEGFERQQVDIAQNAWTSLQLVLTTGGWQSLQVYRAEQFSQSVTTWEVPKP